MYRPKAVGGCLANSRVSGTSLSQNGLNDKVKEKGKPTWLDGRIERRDDSFEKAGCETWQGRSPGTGSLRAEMNNVVAS